MVALPVAFLTLRACVRFQPGRDRLGLPSEMLGFLKTGEKSYRALCDFMSTLLPGTYQLSQASQHTAPTLLREVCVRDQHRFRAFYLHSPRVYNQKGCQDIKTPRRKGSSSVMLLSTLASLVAP